MKNFVKGIDQNGAGFAYLKETFPRISDTKIKEGIFVGPQIRELPQNLRRPVLLVSHLSIILNRFGKSTCPI
jgi:hypothetical protein